MKTSDKLINNKDLIKVFQFYYDTLYPIGKARKLQFAGEDDPNTSKPYGIVATWELDNSYNDKFLKPSSTSVLGSTGGDKTQTLTINTIPSHDHGGLQGAGYHNHVKTTNEQGEHTHTSNTGYNSNLYLPDGDRLLATIWQYEGGAQFYMSNEGSHNHSFTTTENGSHTHTIKYSGSGQAFNIEPQYKTVKMWKRVS